MCEKSGEKRENFHSLRQRFLRHLSAGYNVNELSKKFGALARNFERVDFVLDLLEKTKFDFGFVKDGKDDEVAVKFREQGNEMFKIKKLKEAWEFYTKSISHAENNSVNLALAYANRSAVLFEVNLHKQCLMDINKALENNYPEHLKPKLFVREKNSRNLEIEAFKNPYKPIPTLPSQNPNVLSAANCVQIAENEQSGRHVVATRDIEPGEVLAIEKPFASLIVGQFLNHCHECLTLCYSLQPCQQCTEAMYCSDTCREKAFETYHKHECPLLATLRTLEFDKLKILPLKIALSIGQEYKDIDKSDGVYRSDRYREIHNLIANTSQRSIPDLFERATAAAAIFTLVKNHTNFFDDSDENARRSFKEVVLLHMQTGPSNFHEITELAPNSREVYEQEEVASGAYAFLSLLNHSCDPNVTRFCYSSVIVLRAIRSIKKGEQCFDNYGYHYVVLDIFRQLILSKVGMVVDKIAYHYVVLDIFRKLILPKVGMLVDKIAYNYAVLDIFRKLILPKLACSWIKSLIITPCWTSSGNLFCLSWHARAALLKQLVLTDKNYHYAVLDKAERRKQLKKQYYFDCSCVACENDWPRYDSLPSLEGEEIEDSLMKKLSSAEVEFAEEILQDSLSRLKKLEEHVPCKNFCQIQEVVKQCFATLASKRRMF